MTFNSGKANSREKRIMKSREENLEKQERSLIRVWTRWDLPKKKISWADLWTLEYFHISISIMPSDSSEPAEVEKYWPCLLDVVE